MLRTLTELQVIPAILNEYEHDEVFNITEKYVYIYFYCEFIKRKVWIGPY